MPGKNKVLTQRIRTLQQQAQKMNLDTYNMYLNRLIELGMSMFEWTNVPDTIDIRFLELTLFQQGAAVFFHDDIMGYLALQVAYNGPLNVYHIPIKRRAYATSGYSKRLDITNSVMIWNNALHSDTYFDVCQYAYRLAVIERAIDVNVNGQKTPIIIQCADTQRLTMKNLYMSYDGFEPFIFGDKNLDLSGIRVLNTNVPFIADKLQQMKRQMWQEAMASIGIESIVNEKASRLVAAEAEVNKGAVAAQRYVRLNARRQACIEINRMFGLNIEVNMRNIEEAIPPIPEFTELMGEEAKENE